MTPEEDSLSICFGSAPSPFSFGTMFLSPDAFCSYGVEFNQMQLRKILVSTSCRDEIPSDPVLSLGRWEAVELGLKEFA